MGVYGSNAFIFPDLWNSRVIRILCGCRVLKPDLADDNACLIIDLIPLFYISEQVRLSSRYLLFLLLFLLLLLLLVRVALF